MAKNSKTEVKKLSLFERSDLFLQKNDWIFFWFIFALTAIISFALYDPRVSLSGDDSTYIIGANNFIKDFIYPGFQGPLYPIALSLVIALFGISLFPLKLFSLLSILAFMYMTFISFRKKIPATLLMSVLLLTSINSFVLYYASQTYSEAFYMFMQSVFIYVFFRFFIDNTDKKRSFLSLIKRHGWLALALLGAILTRSVGFSLVIAVFGYFLLNKQWKNLGLSIACFLIIFLAYTGIKSMLWPENGFQLSSQGSSLLNKNYYQPEMGKEDLAGFITRLFQNSNQYLSNGLFRIMGVIKNPENKNGFVTLLIYGAAIIGLLFSFKKNKYIFFSGIMTGVFLIVTFLSLQVFWNQERLIIPQYTFILLILFAALYFFLAKKKFQSFQFIYYIVIVILLFSGINNTTTEITKARKIKTVYSGLSPDWVHYLKAGEWFAENSSKDEIATCRKPTISTIYANGKYFHGIFSIPTGDKEVFINKWKNEPNTYLAIPMTNENFRPAYYQYTSKEQVARIEMGQAIFMITNGSEQLKNTLSENNIQYIGINDFEQLANSINDQYSIYYPDSLLQLLKDSKVTHILSAQLRINPEVKNGYTISTVERYAFYIQEKYGDIFEQIYQEGTNEDEPARIYRIKWEMLEGN